MKYFEFLEDLKDWTSIYAFIAILYAMICFVDLSVSFIKNQMSIQDEIIRNYDSLLEKVNLMESKNKFILKELDLIRYPGVQSTNFSLQPSSTVIPPPPPPPLMVKSEYKLVIDKSKKREEFGGSSEGLSRVLKELGNAKRKSAVFE
jgi:hypothetical protein